jgi:hypothetical protein
MDAARRSGALLGLDEIEPERLAAELATYVRQLLATSRHYGQADMRKIRTAIATAVATVLTAGDTPGDAGPAAGAFLVAGLYVQHLLSQPGALTAAEVDRVATQVPRTLGGVLELHLAHMGVDAWRRPLLAALAYAKGAGMPASLLSAVATVFRDGAVHLSNDRFAATLDSIRFYLRYGTDDDKTTLYRLFH